VIRTDPLTGRLVKIPKGHVWLQGDNMANSNDSRDYGAVPEAILKGRVLARISFLNRPFFERLPNGFKDVSEDKSEES
jgi:Signal peptidase, peptidase S26